MDTLLVIPNTESTLRFSVSVACLIVWANALRRASAELFWYGRYIGKKVYLSEWWGETPISMAPSLCRITSLLYLGKQVEFPVCEAVLGRTA